MQCLPCNMADRTGQIRHSISIAGGLSIENCQTEGIFQIPGGPRCDVDEQPNDDGADNTDNVDIKQLRLWSRLPQSERQLQQEP